MDILQRNGHYPVPASASKILGVEFSGTIESLGADSSSSGFKHSDSVFGLAYGGAYAEYIAVPTQMLLHKPEHLSYVQAAGVCETFFTALQALTLVGSFQKGHSVLWHAGASGVSIAGIQLSRALGAAAIYVTAGSQEKIDFCVKELGATAGFNYKTQDWAAEVTKATGGEGVDLVVDFVGADYFQGNLDVAARDGCIVNLGLMSGSKLKEGTDISAFVRKRLRFEGSSLRSRDPSYQGKLRDKLEDHLPKFESGDFKVLVDKVLPWEEIKEAHEYMETDKSRGKIICTIGDVE